MNHREELENLYEIAVDIIKTQKIEPSCSFYTIGQVKVYITNKKLNDKKDFYSFKFNGMDITHLSFRGISVTVELSTDGDQVIPKFVDGDDIINAIKRELEKESKIIVVNGKKYRQIEEENDDLPF